MRAPNGGYRKTTDELPPPARVTMPADWVETCGADFLGRVRYRRVFQLPTGLDSGERVFLVIEPPRSRGVITLSDRLLGEMRAGDAPFRTDITDLLEDHNRLVILVDHPSLDEADAATDDGNLHLPGGLVGEVRLEIEE
jgi:hypothetical protein